MNFTRYWIVRIWWSRVLILFMTISCGECLQNEKNKTIFIILENLMMQTFVRHRNLSDDRFVFVQISKRKNKHHFPTHLQWLLSFLLLLHQLQFLNKSILNKNIILSSNWFLRNFSLFFIWIYFCLIQSILKYLPNITRQHLDKCAKIINGGGKHGRVKW